MFGEEDVGAGLSKMSVHGDLENREKRRGEVKEGRRMEGRGRVRMQQSPA